MKETLDRANIRTKHVKVDTVSSIEGESLESKHEGESEKCSLESVISECVQHPGQEGISQN